MFGTPDFGHSDIWHFNFALKFFLSETLKKGYFPLWSKDLGTGFPLLGEGQTGIFNLYNLLAFRFLDPVLAFNLGYLVIFLTTAAGTFLFGRLWKLSRFSALFFAFIFSFSGIFVTHIVHFNLIQAASFLPWLFFLAEKYFQTKKKRFLLIFSLVLSQQIYSGFPQMTMITLIGLAIYALGRKNFPALVLPVFAGVFLAWPQLLPSLQLSRESFREGGVTLTEMVKYPFSPVNFLGFIYPYIFGDPRRGTYPPFGPNWGIFWESTGYFGLLPLFLAISGLKRVRKNLIFWVLSGIAAVLLLGRFTPLFFLYQLPPLSLFRVPARFLFLFVWAIAILAAFAFDRIKSKPVKIFILILTCLDLGYFAVSYNRAIDPKIWLVPPKYTNILSEDKSWWRLSSLYSYVQWNRLYQSRDSAVMSKYEPLRNSLDPNQNLYWNIASADLYAGMTFKRQEIWRNLVNLGNPRLFSLAGVKYLTSPTPLPDFELLASPSADLPIFLYRNPGAYPHAYLTSNYEVAENIPNLIEKLTEASQSAAIIEEKIDLEKSAKSEPANVVQNSDLEVIIETSAAFKALLVLSDSYYPGWYAEIDGVKTKIYPVNLNQRAVIVFPGSHRVRFSYEPFAPDNILSLFHP